MSGMTKRDEKGRVLPGYTTNPQGHNQYTVAAELNPFLEALGREGRRRGDPFWDMVAKKCYTNNSVLMAVLKKILPDKLQGEGFGVNNYAQIFNQISEGDLKSFINALQESIDEEEPDRAIR